MMPRDRETFSPAQSRAARGLLGWSAADCIATARLELEALELYEAGEAELGDADLARLGAAYYAAGVIAVPANFAGEGVRWVRPRTPFAGDALSPVQGAPLGQDPFDRLPLASRSRAAGQLVRQVARALDMQTRLGWSRGW